MTVPRWALFVVDLWAALRRQAGTSPLGGRGAMPLPGPGSFLDQPAALMDALTLLDHMIAEGKDG
ncbi:MAG: hypothetical protein U5M50_03950 [Sphingobium sp.]|nr:hypothetical protein [Sphingobium sp.]